MLNKLIFKPGDLVLWTPRYSEYYFYQIILNKMRTKKIQYYCMTCTHGATYEEKFLRLCTLEQAIDSLTKNVSWKYNRKSALYDIHRSVLVAQNIGSNILKKYIKPLMAEIEQEIQKL